MEVWDCDMKESVRVDPNEDVTDSKVVEHARPFVWVGWW